ncbi:MAG: alkaline phosphatase family protein [Actinomycetota bacterium]|nr:alkaline phosphatase family protein [Actinomycetota bacterium]
MVTFLAATYAIVFIAHNVLGLGRDNGPDGGNGRPTDPVPSELSEHAYIRQACNMPAEWIKYIDRGYEPGPAQGKDLIIVPKPPGYVGGLISTTHSGPYDFLMDVPLTFYGPGFVEPRGRITPDREVTVADLAPTYADLVGFDLPERDGVSLIDELKPTPNKPRLIVTIAIDGGGWNVLETWPDAWPNLKEFMEKGINFDNATVGSSPSVTPATHSNMGTGAFPKRHQVTAIVVRKDDGEIVGSFSRDLRSAGSDVVPNRVLQMGTFADLYDVAMNNEPKVALVGFGNYITGMVGHGANWPGGDHDIVAFEEVEGWATDPEFYSLPEYLTTELPGPEADYERVDVSDGQADGLWRGHEISPLDATPAYAPWQNRAIIEIIEREGFGQDDVTDLMNINYKAPDAAGHKWNMIGPEQEDVLVSTDEAIGDLVDFLDNTVGEENYLVVITADHGQTPLEAGGWPIYRLELLQDVARVFDHTGNDVGVIDQTTATTIFLRPNELETNDTTPEQMAAFLSDYRIEDNIGTQDYPAEFNDRKNEKIFAGVFPGRKLDEVVACSKNK